jgi:hypothetical protein
MFETWEYSGTAYTNDSGVNSLDGNTCQLKWCQIATPDPEPSLVYPPSQLTPDLDAPPPPDASTINPDEILASRWTGHDDVGDSDDDVDFEGHLIPQLMEVSDDEDGESELDLDSLWGDEVAEDLLGVLETNIELDACDAGVWRL